MRTFTDVTKFQRKWEIAKYLFRKLNLLKTRSKQRKLMLLCHFCNIILTKFLVNEKKLNGRQL